MLEENGVREAGRGLTADETTFRKLVLRVAATARASSVLPIRQLLHLSPWVLLSHLPSVQFV